MIKVSKVVEEIIKGSPFLQESLAEGIINLSSLARKIQPDVEKELHKKIKTGAIVMTLNRLSPSLDIHISKQIKNFNRNLGDIMVRSDLIDYTYRNSESLKDKQSKLLKVLSDKKDIFYTITQGNYETTIVLSSSFKGQMIKIFEKEELISITKNLSAITIKLPQENTKISGIYYFIFKKIAWEGINIVEVISTANEFTILVDERSIDRAFSILKNLKN